MHEDNPEGTKNPASQEGTGSNDIYIHGCYSQLHVTAFAGPDWVVFDCGGGQRIVDAALKFLVNRHGNGDVCSDAQ